MIDTTNQSRYLFPRIDNPHLISLPQAGGGVRFELYGRLVFKMNRSFLAMVSFITLGMAAPAPAQNRDAALAALMKLPAVERHARLVEEVKKESGLVWYSSTTAEDALALSKKFNEQYPSIQIQHLRSSSEKLLERILAESRANAFKADIVTLPDLELSIMIKRKLLVRYEGVENSLAGKQRSA